MSKIEGGVNMGMRHKDIGFDLGDLGSAAIKKAALDERRQERISWIIQVVVPLVLMGTVLWFLGGLFNEFLNGLSEAIITQNGGALK